MSDRKEDAQKGWFQKGNRKVFAVVAGTVVAVGSAFGVQALADGKTYSHVKLMASDGASWHNASWRGGHHGRFADMTDTEIEAKIERMVKHVAIEIDATEDQQTKITALMFAVAKDLKPLRADMMEAGKEMHELLLSDTIDRAAFEKLRTERLAEIDRISKTMVTAAADVAEVLTVQQREILNERIKQFRSMRKRWHRG